MQIKWQPMNAADEVLMKETLSYYNQNADAFIEGTRNADMSMQYRQFLKYLSPGCKLLDLGCGSGRDSAYFSSLGFAVTAADGSEELCKRVRENHGIPALCIKFEELSFAAQFDAIWACASLLHVKKSEMPDVMKKVSAALKPGGILYASFKYGSEERFCNGRFFSDYTEKDLDTLLTPETQLSLLEYRITEDVRPDRCGERWLNFIAKKQ
jgi:SAM-dependent methyltransferase